MPRRNHQSPNAGSLRRHLTTRQLDQRSEFHWKELMVAVWSGSFSRKSHILAAAGNYRLSKRKRRRGKGKRRQPPVSLTKREQKERINWTWAYQQRNNNLKSLGYESYAAYLESDLWKSIRKRVLKRDRHICFGCGKTACQVHHRNYEIDVLQGKSLGPLVSICHGCHESIELDRFGNKISLKAANGRLKAIRRNRRLHSAST